MGKKGLSRKKSTSSINSEKSFTGDGVVATKHVTFSNNSNEEISITDLLKKITSFNIKTLLDYKFEEKNSNFIVVVLTIISFIVHFWRIDFPSEVVFDEVHFGKFASFYLRRTFFTDVHPPLARLLFAFVGWLVGYDGSFLFENIKESYIGAKVPYIAYRSLPAGLASLSVPLTYLTVKEAGFSIPACILSACFILFDNAMVCISRLIMLDAILLFAVSCSFYCYVKFYKQKREPFSYNWWKWLLLTGFSLSCVISSKYIGVFTFISIGIAIVFDLIKLLNIKSGNTLETVGKHVASRLVCLIVFPFIVYLFWFKVQFMILTHSGAYDASMSPEFQSTLLENPIDALSFGVNYYDTVKIENLLSNAYLRSYDKTIPLQHDNGRISSQGQVVTAGITNDDNSKWIIYPPIENAENDEEYSNSRPLKFGDRVRFLHVVTNSFLLSHDVASYSDLSAQEVTGTRGDQANTNFKDTIFVLKPAHENAGDFIFSKKGHMRIVHEPTNVLLWTDGTKFLPEWGFHEQEVITSRDPSDRRCIWYFDEIVDMDESRKLTKEDKSKYAKWKLSFFRKYKELQTLMFRENSQITEKHPASSSPLSWPITWKGVSFWTQNDKFQQIYFHGNPFGWCFEFFTLVVFTGTIVLNFLMEQRNKGFLSKDLQTKLFVSSGFFILSWAMNYFPFFLMGRILFLHHYLSAHICLAMNTGTMLDFFTGITNTKLELEKVRDPSRDFKLENSKTKNTSTSSKSSEHSSNTTNSKGEKELKERLEKNYIYAWIALAVILFALISTFLFFAPFTYGTPGLTIPELKARRWLGFDLQFYRPVTV